MADFKMYNQELRDRNGRTVGKIYNNDIRDNNGRTVGKVYNDEIRDINGRTIVKIYNNEIRDTNGWRVATIGDAMKEIDGTNMLNPKLVVALWIFFVKRGR